MELLPRFALVTELLDADRQIETITLDLDDGRRRAWAYEQGIVLSEERDENGIRLKVRWDQTQAVRFSRL